jgi:diguanylate cyclase (GGDEF)-like protein
MSKILIVDDSKTTRLLIQSTLNKNGFEDTVIVNSAKEAFKILNLENPSDCKESFDLILMDLMMPEIDGIGALKKIKAVDKYKDLPCIMLSGESDTNTLEQAFEAGAMDYVSKVVNKVELLARVRSAIRFKKVIDRYDSLLSKYEDATNKLDRSNVELVKYNTKDPITGLSNKRCFEEFLDVEWKRMKRVNGHLSLILLEPDSFSEYIEKNGSQKGNDCLQFIGAAIKGFARRPSDIVAFLGDNRFGIILSDTNLAGCIKVAENMRYSVENRKIPHNGSINNGQVTISGVLTTAIPNSDISYNQLLSINEDALKDLKKNACNTVKYVDSFSNFMQEIKDPLRQ